MSVAREPLRKIPANPKGLSIALRFSGGVGDVAMAIGGTAYALKDSGCKVVAACMEHQTHLMSLFQGISEVVDTTELNEPKVFNSFDVIVDFFGVLNTAHNLRPGCYYEHISKKVGFSVGPGKIELPNKRMLVGGRPVVCLHPGASNPNRRWGNPKWKELAYELAYRGQHVLWLGTRNEFGFSDNHVEKLSDESEDLVMQTIALSSGSYFIGNDSGFAHLAGIMDIPGVVIFGNTEPRDVIGKYPSLVGVDKYEKFNGLAPTRNFIVRDPISLDALNAVKWQDIMDKTPYCNLNSGNFSWYEPNPKDPVMAKIAVVTNLKDGEILAKELSHSFSVDVLDNIPGDASYDAVLLITADRCEMQTRKGRCRINLSNLASVERAITERI